MTTALSEAAWFEQVRTLLNLYGWLFYHTHDSRRSNPGFPDLCMVHPARGGLMLAELKTDRGKLSTAQGKWLELLRRSGLRAEVWRPADLDHVIALLSAFSEEAGQ